MKTASVVFGIALALGACSSSPSIEDGANDSFTSGGKADGFGVEDSSPDGAAVLTLASTADAAKLENDVGLAAKVAQAIIVQRATLPNQTFTNLADLDAAKYVGTKVFDALLAYCTEQHLYKTSLRVPLLVQDYDDDTKTVSLASFNAQATANGLPTLPAYVWVDDSTDFFGLTSTYSQELQTLLTQGAITLPTDWGVMNDADTLQSYAAGGQTVCFVGDATKLADTVTAQVSIVVSEMYAVWAWRVGTDQFVDKSFAKHLSKLGDDFKNYDTTSTKALIVYSNGDDNTNISDESIAPCR